MPFPRRSGPVNLNVVLLDLGGGTYEEHPVDARERKKPQIYVGGRAWSHVKDDEHGRWIYRRT